jgi:hypothetical protein
MGQELKGSLEIEDRGAVFDRPVSFCERLGANGATSARTIFPLERMVRDTIATYEDAV